MSSTELGFTPATELTRLIRTKALSPVELTRAVLERIERVNPVVNAFCTLTAEQALAAAREAERAVTSGAALGPLHGVPYSIKDLNFTKGVRTMGGSFIFEHRVPEADAAFIPRLRKAGGIFVGKTTSPEFGWKALGDSPLTGITRNPWNTGTTTGARARVRRRRSRRASARCTRAPTAQGRFGFLPAFAEFMASSRRTGGCRCGRSPTTIIHRTTAR